MLAGWECTGRAPRGGNPQGPSNADVVALDNKLVSMHNLFQRNFNAIDRQISIMKDDMQALQERSKAHSSAILEKSSPLPTPSPLPLALPEDLQELRDSQRDQSSRLTCLEQMMNSTTTLLDTKQREEELALSKRDSELIAKVEALIAKVGRNNVEKRHEVPENSLNEKDLANMTEMSKAFLRADVHSQIGRKQNNGSWFQMVHDILESLKHDIDLQNSNMSERLAETKASEYEGGNGFSNSNNDELSNINDGIRACSSDPQEQELEVVTALQDAGETQIVESVWSFIMFVGTPALGVGGSSIAVVLLLLNLAVQSVFSIVCWFSFTTNPFDDDAIQSAVDFRINIAHDNRHKNSVSGNSLAYDLCAEDGSLLVAAGQSGLLGDSREYLGKDELQKIFGGPLMCFLALLCWQITVSKELVDIFRFYVTICQMKRGKTTQLILSSDSIELKSITLGRFVVVSIVCVFRACMAVWLIIVGSLFLAYTTTASDLLLNAVALEFIISLQYLIFEALAPVCTRTLLARLQPLQVRVPRLPFGFDPLPCITLIGVCTGVMIFQFIYNAKMVGNMQQYDDELCLGNVDFVFATDGLEIPYIVSTSSKASQETMLMKAVKESIAVDSLHNHSLVYGMDPSKFGLTIDGVAAKDVTDAVELYSSPCTDNLMFRSSPLTELAKYNFKDPSFQGLSPDYPNPCDQVDFDLHCSADLSVGAYARAACPVKCGCSQPLSQLALKNQRNGCPWTCSSTDVFLTSLNMLNCTDKSKAELDQAEFWQSWTHELIKRNNDFTDFGIAMKATGCMFLQYIAKQAPFLKALFCRGETLAPIPALAPVCPVTCGCGIDPYISPCPKTCY